MESTLFATSDVVSNSQPISVQIVSMVADREGIDPTELEVSLYDVVDPEALDRLFEPRNGSQRGGRVEFTYYGYHVVVESDDGGDGAVITLEQVEDASTPSREERGSTADTSHYCLDCDWALSANETYSTNDRSELAIDHHLETGHTIESVKRTDGLETEGTGTDDGPSERASTN